MQQTSLDVLELDECLSRLRATPRPGEEKVLAWYDHRLGGVCLDPRLMLIPLDDHLVHRGDGVFESLKFMHGRLYQLDPHIARMKRSSRAIHLQPPCSWERLAELIVGVARACGTDRGMVRVLLGRGPGGFGIDPAECPEPSLYLAGYRISSKTGQDYERGITAMRTSIPAKQSYMATIKSIDYLPNMLMKREATQHGYDLGLCFDDEGYLAEGSVENVCLVDKAGVLVVPEFKHSLAGTTLLRGIDLLRGEMEVRFGDIAEQDIHRAREMICVGTTVDAMAVVQYNGSAVGDGRPGPVSRRLRELLQQDLLENGTPL